MKFHSLRTSLVGAAFSLIAAVLLGSCGGGGAGANNTGGALLLLPATATFFAGMPATMTISGGRRPYRLVSSEPGILPVPSTLDESSFTVIPSNPGVVDSGLPDDSLPIRTVVITVTDAENNAISASIRVALNFLTGYGITFNSNCPVAGGTVSPQACAGGETALRIEANFNGALIGNRTYRLEVLRGPFFWVYPDGSIAGNTITVTTDHEGKAFAIFRVNSNVPTQLGVFRIIDVETGVSTEHVFIIAGTPLAAELAIIPDEFTFTGRDTATCGTGSGQFLVFDGLPPYSAFSANAQVTVTPASTDAQPGLFSFSVNDPSTCLTDATIVVVDARLARGIVSITTEVGTEDPPPPPLRAVPSSLALLCGQTASSLVAGGSDPLAALITTNPDTINLNVTTAGRTVSVQRLGALPQLSLTMLTRTVNVSDGTSTTAISVRYPQDCS